MAKVYYDRVVDDSIATNHTLNRINGDGAWHAHNTSTDKYTKLHSEAYKAVLDNDFTYDVSGKATT